MSFRGRQQARRSFGGFSRVSECPHVNRYNPVRDVACQQVKVPYGQTYVDGLPDVVRSHEIILAPDGQDRQAMIDRDQIKMERLQRQADRQWYERGQTA